MKVKLSSLLIKWLEFRNPALNGKRYTIENPAVLLKNHGTIRLSDGTLIRFDTRNKGDIMKFVYFLVQTGIRLGSEKFQWKLDQDNGIIETHQGIRLGIRGLGPFALNETFLNQIHFSGLDLRGKVVITAGAYIGDTPLFYSLYGATVIAFEPSPTSYAIAKENVSLNPELSERITLINGALGTDGEVDFPLEDDSGDSSIYNANGRHTLRVKCRSISTILREYNIKEPYLLDLDIKGAEYSVIEDQSLFEFSKIRIEYSPYLLHDTNKSLAYLLARLDSYGFRKVRIYKHNNPRYDLTDHGTLEAEK